MQNGEATGGIGSGGDGVNHYPIPSWAASLPPFFPWTCYSESAGTGPRKPIVEWEAYGAVRRFKSLFLLKPTNPPSLIQLMTFLAVCSYTMAYVHPNV